MEGGTNCAISVMRRRRGERVKDRLEEVEDDDGKEMEVEGEKKDSKKVWASENGRKEEKAAWVMSVLFPVICFVTARQIRQDSRCLSPVVASEKKKEKKRAAVAVPGNDLPHLWFI